MNCGVAQILEYLAAPCARHAWQREQDLVDGKIVDKPVDRFGKIDRKPVDERPDEQRIVIDEAGNDNMPLVSERLRKLLACPSRAIDQHAT